MKKINFCDGKTEKKSFSEILKTILKLYAVFFKIGSVMFGGGLAMLPILETELVEKRKWTTSEQLSDYFAISQVTPGVIAVNVATFLGFVQAGVLGGIFATLGVVTPSIIIISLISYFIEALSSVEWVQSALSGINVAVCCLLFSALVKFIKNGIKSCNIVLAICLMVLSFCVIVFFHVPTSLTIIVGDLLGVVIYVVKSYKKKGNKK